MKDAQRFYDLDLRSQRLKNVAEQCLVDIVQQKNPRSLLEIGCGDGHFIEIFSNIKAIGIDKDQAMLELAKKRNVPAYLQDVTDPSIRELGLYDVIVSNYVFTELSSTQLQKTFSNLSSMSEHLCFTITNPHERHRMNFPGYRLCFETPFDYAAHDVPFRVELEDTLGDYTDVGIRDFHQPLTLYHMLLKNAGYYVTQQEIYADLDYPYALLIDATRSTPF